MIKFMRDHPHWKLTINTDSLFQPIVWVTARKIGGPKLFPVFILGLDASFGERLNSAIVLAIDKLNKIITEREKS